MKKLLLCALYCLSSLIALEPPLKKQKVTEEDFFEYLPNEIKEQIASVVSGSATIEDGVASLLSLMQTNKNWYSFLNDPSVTNTLIQIISQKYQVSTVVAAAYLATNGAQLWLTQRIDQQRFITSIMINSALHYLISRGGLNTPLNKRATMWLLAQNAVIDADATVHLDGGDCAHVTRQLNGEHVLIIISRTGKERTRVSLPHTKNERRLSCAIASNDKHIIISIFSTSSATSRYIASFNYDGTFNQAFGTRGIVSLDLPIIEERDIDELNAIAIDIQGAITLSCIDENNQPIAVFLTPEGVLDTSSQGGFLPFIDIDENHELIPDTYRSIRLDNYLITSGIEKSSNKMYVGRTMIDQATITNLFILPRFYVRRELAPITQCALFANPTPKEVTLACYESSSTHRELKILTFNSTNGRTSYTAFTRWGTTWVDTSKLYQELAQTRTLDASGQAIDRWISSVKIASELIAQDSNQIKWITSVLTEMNHLFPQSIPDANDLRTALVYASIPQARRLLASLPHQVIQEALRHTIAFERFFLGGTNHVPPYHQATTALVQHLISQKKQIGPAFDTDFSHRLFVPSNQAFGIKAYSSGESPVSLSDYSRLQLIDTFGTRGTVTVPGVPSHLKATALYLDERSKLITLAGSFENTIVTAQIDAVSGALQRGPVTFNIADIMPRLEGITLYNNHLILWGRTRFFGKDYIALIKVSRDGTYQTHELVPFKG